MLLAHLPWNWCVGFAVEFAFQTIIVIFLVPAIILHIVNIHSVCRLINILQKIAFFIT